MSAAAAHSERSWHIDFSTLFPGDMMTWPDQWLSLAMAIRLLEVMVDAGAPEKYLSRYYDMLAWYRAQRRERDEHASLEASRYSRYENAEFAQ